MAETKTTKTVIALFLIVIMVLPAALLIGCTSGAAQAPQSTWTVTDGITYKLMQDSFPPDVEEITVIMENRSDMVMRYGGGYFFERYWGGMWHMVDRLNHDLAFFDLGYSLAEYSRDTFTIQLTSAPLPLTGGLYRVTGLNDLELAPGNRDIREIEDFEEYPPWQLEFRISRGADDAPEDEPGKRDWEWYMVGDVYDSDLVKKISLFVTGENGLVAVLIEDGVPGSADTAGNRYTMEIFDRKTGSRHQVYINEITDTNSVKTHNEGFLAYGDSLYYVWLNDKGQIEKTDLSLDEPDDVVMDITGTYVGESIVINAEYFKVKDRTYIEIVEVGTTNDLTLEVVLDETTGQYYIDGNPAQKTGRPNGGVHLETTSEYDGSMSMKTTTSLIFIPDEEEITGTMIKAIFIYGAVTARETWSITAIKQ